MPFELAKAELDALAGLPAEEAHDDPLLAAGRPAHLALACGCALGALVFLHLALPDCSRYRNLLGLVGCPVETGCAPISVPALHHRRAPGNTCLSALRADRKGTIEQPPNMSKGCGGVMRIAPAGVVGPAYGGDSFELGCEIAALTHGHPSGYLAAGALAELLRLLVEEWSIDEALGRVERRLIERAGHEETLEALRSARAIAVSSVEPGPEAVESLGEGWVAEEALAVAVYCALVARRPQCTATRTDPFRERVYVPANPHRFRGN